MTVILYFHNCEANVSFHSSFVVMSGLPDKFGVGSEVTKDTPLENVEIISKKVQVEGPSRLHKKTNLHKHTLPSFINVHSKRPKVVGSSPSLVSSNLGSLVEPFIRDTELKSWVGRPENDIQRAMATTSAELYYYTIMCLTTMSDQEARLKSLEEEKNKLKNELAEALMDNGHLKNNLDTHIATSKKEEKSLEDLLTAKDASLADALAKVQDLQGEVATLKANRENTKVDAYTEGFRGYLKGFLVVDPDYDWVDSERAPPNGWRSLKHQRRVR